MNITLLHNSPLEVADIAISKCYGKEPYTDLEKQQGRINRVANVSKHSSTIEHINYVFDIDGISRAVLQEVARHRIASYTVKSTRYTLKELKTEEPFVDFETNSIQNQEAAKKYIVMTGEKPIDFASIYALGLLQDMLKRGYPNDKAKYCLPESYKTALVMTINARALQNFLALRTDSHALWEIQNLAWAMYWSIPEDHKFLFKDHVSCTESTK